MGFEGAGGVLGSARGLTECGAHSCGSVVTPGSEGVAGVAGNVLSGQQLRTVSAGFELAPGGWGLRGCVGVEGPGGVQGSAWGLRQECVGLTDCVELRECVGF